MKEKKKTKLKGYGLIVFCLALLFNPNISIVDILPDFIAYFIVYRMLTRASDRAPYFAEARQAVKLLGWLTLAKLPALILLGGAKNSDAFGNDMMALMSIAFATLELILMIQATRNLFDAFFRLGERTDALSLIRPYPISKSHTRSPETLRYITYAFAITKCAAYVIPDLFLLTRIKDTPAGTQIITILKGYPMALLITLVLALACGILWLSNMKKYMKAVLTEGLFDASLEKIAAMDPSNSVERKEKLRSLSFSLTLLVIAAIFSLEIRFDNTYEVNLFPHLIFALVILYAAYKLSRHTSGEHKALIGVGAVYAILTLITYVTETHFLIKYGYEALLRDEAARNFYVFVDVFASLEFVTLAVFAILLAIMLRQFVLENTGIEKSDPRYGRMDEEYHSSLIKRSVIFSVLLVVSGAAKLANVISSGAVKEIFSDVSDVTKPVIIAPSIAWIGMVVVFTAIIFIGYAAHYSSTLKEEVEMKYSELK